MKKELTFPEDEYLQRTIQARRLMAKEGVDALLIGTGPNLTYFSGYTSPERSGSRPCIFILPLESDPVFIVQNGREFETNRYSWVQDVRTYAELSRAPLGLIEGTLHEMGLTEGRIGMELGFEQCLDIPVLDFLQLRDDLPTAHFLDAADILWELRMVKSEAEIACIRKACEITSRYYEECLPQIHAGMTELDVFHLLANKVYELGGESFFAVITSGEGNYDFISKGPTGRILQQGDMVWIDSACSVSGYWSDFGRAAVLGGPTPQQRHAQKAIHEVTMLGVEIVRPGIRASEVAKACNAGLKKLDFAYTSCISALASRVGHGIGVAVTELPHVAEYDDTILQPGMVITIEPGVATTYGTFHIEEDVLVTEEGYELLSTASRELCG